MDKGYCLQEILGTDKRNPCFTIYRDEVAERLHVYYGGKLFEKVPDDYHSPEYRLMIARLYNAGVKALSLQHTFGLDRKTMRRWGAALKSGDAILLVRVLAGRSGHRKLTVEIETYVRMRFQHIYQEHPRDYSKAVRAEIANVFGTQLCAETLRPLFKELKEMRIAEVYPELSDGDTGCDVDVAEEGVSCLESSDKVSPDRHESPVLPEESDETVRFVHHLGVLLFSALLLMVGTAVTKEGWIVKQWMAAVLLGAINIEQSKLLDFDGLESILGKVLRCLGLQRLQLCALARTDAADRFLQLNADEVNAHTYDAFYYDPHTKHYTGSLKILKGWCGGKHFADKVLHMDFIHTSEGHPVFLTHMDNYEDLRERFSKVVEGFRRLFGIEQGRVLTFVLDRGIYGKETFERVLADEHLHVVTWAKDYKPTTWDKKKVKGTFILERCRNNAEDIKKYQFEYIDQDWEKDPAMRQVRVRATNPKGRMIELGILTDARDRAADEIIRLMFRRWIQENDFKYLEKHFGINQITSYASVSYEDLKNQVENKQMKSGEYKALEKERQGIRNHLKRVLLLEHQHPQKSNKRQTKIKELTRTDKYLTQTMVQTQKEMSRLDYLVAQQYRRLDTSSKKLMDVLKITGRNAFYRALQPFKKMYNNYRDDHVIFRNLTRAHGFMVCRARQVEVHLFPTAHYPPALRAIVEKSLQQINDTKPRMPDGSKRQIIFRLGKKEGIKLASSMLV